MEGFLLVMQVIALSAVTVLCVYLVIILSRFRNFLTLLETNIKELTAKAIPVFSNLEFITDKIKNMSENIEGQIELIKNSVNSVKEITDNIVSFERRVQEQVEEPVLEFIGTVSAIIKGIRTFITRLRA
ncbi:MAG: hypothetical protein QME52_09720 [Bacteroidota bacterium]|nr:hypothetical protein [Bacteroidota bacterium]